MAPYHGWGSWTQAANGSLILSGSDSLANCGGGCQGQDSWTWDIVLNPTSNNNHPDFSLECNPLSSKILPGNTGQTLCSVGSIRGFNQPVSLSCTSPETDIICGFSPNSITPLNGGQVQSTLVISTDPHTPSGAHTLGISGASGAITH
jgi:hypothetical protein